MTSNINGSNLWFDAWQDYTIFLAPPAERQRSFSNADSSVVRRRRRVVQVSQYTDFEGKHGKQYAS